MALLLSYYCYVRGEDAFRESGVQLFYNIGQAQFNLEPYPRGPNIDQTSLVFPL